MEKGSIKNWEAESHWKSQLASGHYMPLFNVKSRFNDLTVLDRTWKST